MMVQGKVIFFSNSFSERRNATVGNKYLSSAEGGHTSDEFSPFRSKLSWRQKDLEGAQSREKKCCLGLFALC